VQSATLDVSGMQGADCTYAVDRVLRRYPGVADAHVSLAAARARVLFDPKRVTRYELANAIAAAGYPAAPPRWPG